MSCNFVMIDLELLHAFYLFQTRGAALLGIMVGSLDPWEEAQIGLWEGVAGWMVV